MSTVENYPGLGEVDAEFLRMLRADPQPLSNLALFWHELLQIHPGTPPKVRSRGDAALLYMREHASIQEVPGRSFPVEKLPHGVCVRTMTEHAGSPSCPMNITFRYERSAEGVWSGGCRIETVAQRQAQVESRKAIDKKLEEALKPHLGPKIEYVKFLYGLRRWDHPGPQLGVMKEGERGVEFGELDAAGKEAWDALVAHLRSHGMQHLYSANIELEKPTARLKEGQNMTLRYSV